MLRRKLTLRAHGRQVVLVKRENESLRHVLMKAGLWALLLPEHPDLVVEGRIGDRYAPDLVALDPAGDPVLWCEAGQVTPRKIASVARRFRAARLIIAKWGGSLDVHRTVYERAVADTRRDAPVEVWVMPADESLYVDDDGSVVIDPGTIRRAVLRTSR